MERATTHQKRIDLEQEVAELQEVLDNEQKLNQILQCSMYGPIICRSCLSSVPSIQVQLLLEEISMVEEEIVSLERRVHDLKRRFYQERKFKNEPRFQQQQQQQQQHHQQRQFLCWLGSRNEIGVNRETSGRTHTKERRGSLGSNAEVRKMCSSNLNDWSTTLYEEAEDLILYRCPRLDDEEVGACVPNKLSEELITILISIFHKLNQTNCESDAAQRLNGVPGMRSRGFMSKYSFNCKTLANPSDNIKQILDPYGILQDVDVSGSDIGSYKEFIHFTRSSLDIRRIYLCLPAIKRLRLLMHKLCRIDPSFMTYKQKLAFWINIYNACIMHAFLQHGLPVSPDKLLTLLNEVAVNVGGVVLNPLAIEHLILGNSLDTKDVPIGEKEALLQHTYGLGYPEPNVTFALCRGSWSSPALRVYTAEDVANQLERAKVEYLEVTVGITANRKKIFIPKLLYWHMRDFADDAGSLLEWIYSQLQSSGPLKRSIRECLSEDSKIPLAKMLEVQPYEVEFRYLLPSLSRTREMKCK